MQEIRPAVAVYNIKSKPDLSNVNTENLQILEFSDTTLNEALIQKITDRAEKDVPLVIVNHEAHLPPFWMERLYTPLLQDNSILLCSALSSNIYSLSPLEASDEFEGNSLQLDNLIYLLQTPSTLFSDKFNPDCFIIRDISVLKHIKETQYHACNNLLVQAGSGTRVRLTEKVDIGDQRPLPAHPLAVLQWKLKSLLGNTQQTHGYPILDNKPVMLHISMSWGGGVSQWINDYCANETDFTHIILSSYGELYRQRHGESLILYYARDSGLIIDTYDLQNPIPATCTQHLEYQHLLNTILHKFQVRQIMVSSLIGHSTQCLQTNIPTIRIFHDYFPSWPSLIADLDSESISNDDIEKALRLTESEPFGRISRKQYDTWKSNLHEIYRSGKIKLAAPSLSVMENLRKIEKDTFDSVSIIPHAIAPLQPITYSRKDKVFKILILGRINPTKGQLLLEEIMQKLPAGVRFIFLGAGNEGKKYLNNKNITVVMEYENSQLQKILQKHQPDIALITSQTSETFNYTLSELQQAGICTLSTSFGALKERINDSETGYLCQNNADDFVEKIKFLKTHPENILKVRKNLKEIIPYSFDDEIGEYKALIPNLKQVRYQLYTVTENRILAKDLQKYSRDKIMLSQSLATTSNLLDERTAWGQQLTKELDKAAKDIRLERSEIKRLKQIISDETRRMEAEIKKLNTEYQKLYTLYQSTLDDKQNTENEKQQIFDELQSVYQSRSWRITSPMRHITTWARHKRNAAKYRWAQLKTLPRRVIRSLRTRGFSGTVSLIKARFQKPKTATSPKTKIVIAGEIKPISIDQSSNPIISVIIPVYNHFDHTWQCLKSISDLNENVSFEVIVVDDCSTDETQKLIKMVSGITYHRQKVNGGFIESCNTGAKLAKGQYLMFLNNDTVVYGNWLDSLLDIFITYPDAGLVGSKLVYPNNQLQEAGGIIFSDASGWNYGRLENPDEPWYNHVREVDYCSGASILIRQDLFQELGCFDERYKPAYYEDTDLAFAVRNYGLKVYYQPASKVTHFEGISSGTDLTQGTKKYQVINQQKFKEKWADSLSRQPKSGSEIELCRIHAQPKRILIFDACTPTPDQDSGSLRMVNLIRILRELEYHVIFMPENLSHNQNYTEDLQQLGVECIYAPHVTNPVDFLKDKGRFLDVVLLSRYYVAEQVMPFIREYCPKAQILFDTVDLHYVRERRMAELENDKGLAVIAEKTRIKELDVARGCDITLVVSPYEVEVLANEIPHTKVSVLTNIHEIYGCRKPFSKRKDIMFIGGYQHTPNVDAVLWFVNDIFPLIVKQLPDVRFHIIGSKAPKDIQNLKSENIVFHGFVEDIEPFMDDIRIAVAPLRYGAGVKGKVNMSMSYGQPVVGTKVAVEGMYTTEGKDVLMAETPEEFAAQVCRLYQDEKLWDTISQGSLENVENYFSFAAAKASIETILKT